MTLDRDTTAFVIDAGARYGMHPTWKGFGGALKYFMFEPDAGEAARLAAKYKDNNRIAVFDRALGRTEGQIEINVLAHHGQSSAFKPNPDSFWFSKTRPDEGQVVGSYLAPMTTIDKFCTNNGMELDFLKCDTEGSELEILMGAQEQLCKNIMGARLEVDFSNTYIGMPNFSDIFNIMADSGFFLLNLDYTGVGDPCNPYFTGSRYGILTGTDGVWMKYPKPLLTQLAARPGRQAAIGLAKYCAFCFISNATDLGIDVLINARKDYAIDINLISETPLYKWIDVSVQHLFYKLLQNIIYRRWDIDRVYKFIFNKQLKKLHEFYQSEEINPG